MSIAFLRLFPSFTDSTTATTVPTSAPEAEPWLDPKYLPPDSSPPGPAHANEGLPEQGHTPDPYSSVTPGVMKTQGILRNGVGPGRGKHQVQGVGAGRLKPGSSSYFPKS